MTEHGWPDSPDDGLHHDDAGGHDEPVEHEPVEHEPVEHDDGYFEDEHHDDALLAHDATSAGHDTPGLHDSPQVHEPQVHEPQVHEPQVHEPQVHEPVELTAGGDEHELQTVGADPDALPEPDAGEAVAVFPPVLDVGPLPEPVDGFPWIDTGSLGLLDAAIVHASAAAEVTPQDLADYAAADLPPGADPWAALAGSDDPATSALAKWWSEHD